MSRRSRTGIKYRQGADKRRRSGFRLCFCADDATVRAGLHPALARTTLFQGHLMTTRMAFEFLRLLGLERAEALR